MDAGEVALVVLAAVALGALLPIAFQLALTLRAARKLIDNVEPRLNRAIDEVTVASASANRALSALDAAALRRTAESVAEIGALAKKAGDLASTIEMASAVGAAAAPAVAAIIRAWREPKEPAPEETPDQPTNNERPVSILRKEMDQR